MKKLFYLLTVVIVILTGFYAFNELVLPLLAPSTGRLSVNVAGQKAKVFLDGRFLGTTPFYATNLRVGNHKVEVETEEREGKTKQRWQTETTLNGSTWSILDLDLAESAIFSSGENLYFRPGGEGISLISRPSGARATVDGKDEISLPFDRPIEPGTHTLTVKKDGYLTREFVVNIESGYKLNAVVFLAADPFETIKKIDGNQRTSLFALFNRFVNLAENFEDWARGIRHIQDSFSGPETRFDAAIDENGKVYIFNQTAWDNKVAAKSLVNVAYLSKKEEGRLSGKAEQEWSKIKKAFE